METTGQQKILTALKAVSDEEWARLNLRLERQFGRMLQRLADGPTAADLLHEAIEDVLTDKRHCPADVPLTTCLRSIVRSKANNVCRKGSNRPIQPLSEEPVLWEIADETIYTSEKKVIRQAAAQQWLSRAGSPEFRETVLVGTAGDAELRMIAAYWLEHLTEDVTLEQAAKALGRNLREPGFVTAYARAEEYLRAALEELPKEQLQQQMLDCVQHDADLIRILAYRFEHPEARARHLAEGLKLPVKKVYQAIKRIKRNSCLKSLYDQLST